MLIWATFSRATISVLSIVCPWGANSWERRRFLKSLCSEDSEMRAVPKEQQQGPEAATRVVL